MKRLITLIAVMVLAVGVMAQGKNSYVDLGLSSGTLWVACNVGAKWPAQEGY